MARVLIADDHAMIRAGLRRWLEQDRSVEAVAEACAQSASDAMSITKR